jgi:enediyne polyketide synthase
VWRDLLGPERFALAGVLAQETGEDLAAAATRVWAAQECLKKAGLMADTPLVLSSSTENGWILFTAGSLGVATLVAPVRGAHDPLALAVLVKSDDARL